MVIRVCYSHSLPFQFSIHSRPTQVCVGWHALKRAALSKIELRICLNPKNLEEENKFQPEPADLEKLRDSLVYNVQPACEDDDDDW